MKLKVERNGKSVTRLVNILLTERSKLSVYAIDERKQISDEEEIVTDPIYIYEKKKFIRKHSFAQRCIGYSLKNIFNGALPSIFEQNKNNCANTLPLNV